MKRVFADDPLMREIARLQESPHVKLAQREEEVREGLRQYMQQLRMLERRGKHLEAQGVTMDVLKQMADACFDE